MNGCWTCRLRRKKCDEARPCCRNCNQLQIDCAYGPKPVWMDRGVLERDAALKIKKQIAARSHRRTKSSSSSSQSAPSSASSDSRPTSDLRQAEDGTRQQSMGLGDGSLVAHQDEDSTWCTATNDMGPGGLNIAGIDTTTSTGTVAEGSPVDFAMWCSEAGILCPEIPLQLDPWDVLSPCNDSGETSPQNTVLGSIEAAQTAPRHGKSVQSADIYPASHNSAMSCSAHSSSMMESDSDWFNRMPPSRGMLTAEDALLLSYYIEEVLPAQFINHGGEKYCWLRFLLLTSAPVLQATLTLAKAYRRHAAGDDHGANTECADLLKNAADAVLGIPSALEALSVGNEERQAEQILNATSRLWQECLQQAAVFAQPLIDLAAMNLDETGDRNQVTSALQMYAAAAKALLGQLIWFDIVGAVSTGGKLHLANDYDSLFASNALPAGGAPGCRNDIVALFYQIICLRHWKLEAEKEKKLNIMELATKGRDILQSLEDITTGINSVALEAADEAVFADFINLAFASTAVIYLHTVISGPSRHLKEIRSETTKLGRILRDLAETQQIGRVPLPVCVAACFSSQDDVGDLRSLISSKQRDGAVPAGSGGCVGVEMRSKACLLTAALEMGRLALRDDGSQVEWTLAGHAAASKRALLVG
ncbi:hypothetical protein QQS21_004916 [Conoideocrella luteorostrata]|uniref:Zn(2)-C6 fungal-type domain-containing protein n=1 Tax=Conoideocrella luteorostrata TaxID=1105319 RepID=A0AAJ0FZG8_9HYPO|nr:hypothetical protein QQS21_004916 [Conoideocrella luteorostrata]